MKSGGEAALAADEIRPALEDLRGQTGGHTSWLTGEGTSHIKPSGRVAAGYHLDRADSLRPACCAVYSASSAAAMRDLICDTSKSLAKPCCLRTSVSFE